MRNASEDRWKFGSLVAVSFVLVALGQRNIRGCPLCAVISSSFLRRRRRQQQAPPRGFRGFRGTALYSFLCPLDLTQLLGRNTRSPFPPPSTFASHSTQQALAAWCSSCDNGVKCRRAAAPQLAGGCGFSMQRISRSCDGGRLRAPPSPAVVCCRLHAAAAAVGGVACRGGDDGAPLAPPNSITPARCAAAAALLCSSTAAAAER